MNDLQIPKLTLRVKDVAEMLSVSKATVWRWVDKGKFPKPTKPSPAITLWRYDEVELWFEENIPPNCDVSQPRKDV